jgi:hypothetical protein
VEPGEGKDLGVRTASPTESQVDISRASSVRSENRQNQTIVTAPGRRDSGDSDTQAVRSHGPNGEEILKEPTCSRTSTQATTHSHKAFASDPTLTNVPEHERSQIDAQEHGLAEGSHKSGGHIDGIVQDLKYHVSGAVSTSELPDGRPESEMKNAKEHALGHIHMGKKKFSS